MASEVAEFSYVFDIISKGIDDETGEWTIKGIASTEAIDREDDVILRPAVEQAMRKYMKRPVLRYMHKEGVGLVKSWDYTDKGLEVEATIIQTDQNLHIWRLIKAGVIRGFSIAGKVLKAVIAKVKDEVTKKIKRIRKITSLEIWEISVVDVPANQESIFEVIKKSAKGIKYIEGDNLPEGEEIQENELKKTIEIMKKEMDALKKQLDETKKEEVVEEVEEQLTEEKIQKIVETSLKNQTLRKGIVPEDDKKPEDEEEETENVEKSLVDYEASIVDILLAKTAGVPITDAGDPWKIKK